MQMCLHCGRWFNNKKALNVHASRCRFAIYKIDVNDLMRSSLYPRYEEILINR